MRLPYEPPELALLGSVVDLTQGGILGISLDGIGGGSDPDEGVSSS